MADKGHEDPFPPTRLSDGSGFGKETITGIPGNGREAPRAVIPTMARVLAHSNVRSSLRTAHAMRASLLTSAIARTLWSNLFLAPWIQALSP